MFLTTCTSVLLVCHISNMLAHIWKMAAAVQYCNPQKRLRLRQEIEIFVNPPSCQCSAHQWGWHQSSKCQSYNSAPGSLPSTLLLQTFCSVEMWDQMSIARSSWIRLVTVFKQLLCRNICNDLHGFVCNTLLSQSDFFAFLNDCCHRWRLCAVRRMCSRRTWCFGETCSAFKDVSMLSGGKLSWFPSCTSAISSVWTFQQTKLQVVDMTTISLPYIIVFFCILTQQQSKHTPLKWELTAALSSTVIWQDSKQSAERLAWSNFYQTSFRQNGVVDKCHALQVSVCLTTCRKASETPPCLPDVGLQLTML